MSEKLQFEIGQMVYLKTDSEQNERIVTGYTVRPGNNVTYALSCGSLESWHYPIEISTERDIVKVTSR